MDITNVNIQRINISEKVKAFAEVTIYGEIVIHDIKVIQGTGKLFVAMPSRKEEGGRYLDIVHPITSECRKEIEDTVLSKYHEYVEALGGKNAK